MEARAFYIKFPLAPPTKSSTYFFVGISVSAVIEAVISVLYVILGTLVIKLVVTSTVNSSVELAFYIFQILLPAVLCVSRSIWALSADGNNYKGTLFVKVVSLILDKTEFPLDKIS